MAFDNRWLIKGTLTTLTPLRIGSGEEVERPCFKNEKAEEPVKIGAVAIDARERAMIPATTIKGRLRAHARGRMTSGRTRGGFGAFETIFGTEPEVGESANAKAGGAEFGDGRADEFTPPEGWHAPPHWCEKRLTGVAASVALMRRTRTAREDKLFHQEYVPPGVSFRVSVAGQDDGGDELKNDEKLAQILRAFAWFNGAGLSLGASTGDEWGRVRWTLTGVKRLDAEGVVKWLESDADERAGYDLLEPLSDEQFAALKEKVRELAKANGEPEDDLSLGFLAGDSSPVPVGQRTDEGVATGCDPARCLTLDVVLTCDGDFLVNDPSRVNKDERARGSDDNEPDHAPLRDVKGNPCAPARSVRGALRAQAERILRTMAEVAGWDDADIMKKVACHPDDPEHSCKSVESLGEVRGTAGVDRKLCMACVVFGAPGWRSPVYVSAFTAEATGEGAPLASQRREMIAIDRFTGGGAHGLKFNADVVYRPALRGAFGVDLSALENVGAELWGLGLLALTFRDLIEGDVRIGSGASKGYGAVRAQVSAPPRLPRFENLSENLRGLIREEDLKVLVDTFTTLEIGETSIGGTLRYAVESLERVIAGEKSRADGGES